MAKAHRGVGLLITNERRSCFVVQQKDDGYPRFPGAFSFFGGAREQGENARQALDRELAEELLPQARALLGQNFYKVFDGAVVTDLANYEFALFEVVISNTALIELGDYSVLEGERAALLTRAELLAAPFVWGLETVARAVADRQAPKQAREGPDAADQR